MPRLYCLAARTINAVAPVASTAIVLGVVAWLVLFGAGCAGDATSRIDPATSTASEKTLTITAPTRRMVEVEVIPPANKEAAPCDSLPPSSPF